MPLSEFLRRAKEKLDSDKQKTCPADISSRVEDDLVELVWENGQIVMHGQSSRSTSSPAVNNVQSSVTRVRDSGGLGNSGAARIGKFCGGETILNDVLPAGHTGELDLISHDDEIVPWLNFPFDDDLAQDYCSELLPEISGVTADGASVQHCLASSDKRSCDHTLGQASDPSMVSGFSNAATSNSTNHMNAIYGCSTYGRNTVNNSSLKMGSLNHDSSLSNFLHFSRPVTHVKANIPEYDGIPNPASVAMERDREKVSASSGTNNIRSYPKAGLKSSQKDGGEHATCAMANSRQQVALAPKEPFPPENASKVTRVSSIKNEKTLVPTEVSNLSKVVLGSEGNVEPMVAASSVGSDNRADREFCEKTQKSKRKMHEIEESECRTDDTTGTECTGGKKTTPSGSTLSKRSRAAEVHNLSERRRRDRINEKMRALQELIPNCNKADKASMLDEAIEYLKTLQLQVQIMSMGAGLCMPPMMFPPGMQHVHPAHVPHISPMGMRMAMGFGPGMLNLNGSGTLGCPIFPVPPMQGAHFTPHTNLHSIPASNFPVFGHPSQGISSVARAPLIPTLQPPTNSTADLSTSRMSRTEGLSTCPTMNTKDPLASKSSQPVHNDEASSSRNQKSNQLDAVEKVLEKPTAMQENNKQTGDFSVTTALASAATIN